MNLFKGEKEIGNFHDFLKASGIRYSFDLHGQIVPKDVYGLIDLFLTPCESIDFVLDVSKVEDNVFPLTCEY